MAGDRAGDVDEVHDRSAEDVPERVGIVREDDLHHLGRAVRRRASAIGQLRQFLRDERLQRAAQLRREILVA